LEEALLFLPALVAGAGVEGVDVDGADTGAAGVEAFVDDFVFFDLTSFAGATSAGSTSFAFLVFFADAGGSEDTVVAAGAASTGAALRFLLSGLEMGATAGAGAAFTALAFGVEVDEDGLDETFLVLAAVDIFGLNECTRS
jgi:hypothetical protein